MADPTPEQLAAIDQNMTLARDFLCMYTARYGPMLAVSGGEVHAQERLLGQLGVQQPDTLLKLLAVAIADRHAEAQRWAQVEALLGNWQARVDLCTGAGGRELQLIAGAYEICIKGLRALVDGGL